MMPPPNYSTNVFTQMVEQLMHLAGVDAEATGISLLRLAQFLSKNTPCSSFAGLKSSRQMS